MQYRITLRSDVNGGRKGPFETLKEAASQGTAYRSSTDGKWYTDNYGAGRNKGDVITTHFTPDSDGYISYMTGNHGETARVYMPDHIVEMVSDTQTRNLTKALSRAFLRGFSLGQSPLFLGGVGVVTSFLKKGVQSGLEQLGVSEENIEVEMAFLDTLPDYLESNTNPFE